MDRLSECQVHVAARGLPSRHPCVRTSVLVGPGFRYQAVGIPDPGLGSDLPVPDHRGCRTIRSGIFSAFPHLSPVSYTHLRAHETSAHL
eukprot:3524261-Alexandrium_andersonii.AAC.1